MSKTTAGLLGVLVLALIALGIIYATHRAAPVVDVPIVEVPSTTAPSTSVPAKTPATVAEVDGMTFRLASYNGTATPADSKYTLAFNRGTLSAKFCNGLGGSYVLGKGTIKATQMVGTLMYCSDTNLMNIETTFSTALRDGATLKQEGNTITIIGSKGEKFVYTKVI